MKKFYFPALLTFLLFLSSGLVQGQSIYVSYPGATGNWSNPLTWQLSFPTPGTAPPNPCDHCTIIINGNVTLDASSGSPYTFNNVGGANSITLGAGASLTINTFVVAIATQFTISDPSTLNVNNELQMFGGQISLNGNGSIVNSTNVPNQPSTGTLYPGDPAGAGIYYNRGAVPPFPLTVAGSTFDAPLSNQGQYKSTLGVVTGFFDPYMINCNGNNGYPPPCASGLVYGPGNIQDVGVAPNDIFQFVPAAPLPVTLLTFTATPGSGKSVNVSWSTVVEINSDYFDVERSADATNFQSIGKISAKGNSSGIVQYSFVDPTPVNAVNYYRLKMVDRDGKFEFSKVAKVVMDENPNSLVIYNNPFHDQVSVKVNLSTGQNLDLRLTDIAGRVLNQQTVKGAPGDNFINIRTSNGANGLYILTIKGQTYNQSVKLIKE